MENTVENEDRHKLYELCKTHLSGKWADIHENDLIIKPIT